MMKEGIVSSQKIIPIFKKKKAKSSAVTLGSSSSTNSSKVVPSFKRKITNATVTPSMKESSEFSATSQTVPVSNAAKKPKTAMPDRSKIPTTPKHKNIKSSVKTPKGSSLKTPDCMTTITDSANNSSKVKRQSSDTIIRMAPSKKLKTPLDHSSLDISLSTTVQSNYSKFACVTKQPIISSQGLSLANEILQNISSFQEVEQSQDSVQQVWKVSISKVRQNYIQIETEKS